MMSDFDLTLERLAALRAESTSAQELLRLDAIRAARGGRFANPAEACAYSCARRRWRSELCAAGLEDGSLS